MMRAMAWLALICALPADAIERIHLRTASVSAGDFGLVDVDAELRIHGAERSTVELRAARVALPQAIELQTGRLAALRLRCVDTTNGRTGLSWNE